MTAPRHFVATTFWMTLGLLTWAAHLAVVYAVAAVACARPGEVPAHVLGAAIGVVTALAVGVAGGVLLRALRRLAAPAGAERGATTRFIDWTASAVAAFGLVAIVWTALPVVVFPACAG